MRRPAQHILSDEDDEEADITVPCLVQDSTKVGYVVGKATIDGIVIRPLRGDLVVWEIVERDKCIHQ